jgi:hypothetical protein
MLEWIDSDLLNWLGFLIAEFALAVLSDILGRVVSLIDSLLSRTALSCVDYENEPGRRAAAQLTHMAVKPPYVHRQPPSACYGNRNSEDERSSTSPCRGAIASEQVIDGKLEQTD